MQFTTKPFSDLKPEELYKILRLRSEVFVVEQDCVFQDMDNKDQIALHFFAEIDHQIVVYARLFDENQYFTETSIGRVVVAPNFRNKNLGNLLMQEAIIEIKKQYNKTNIRIGAQLHLKKFYESHKFVAQGNVYLEDNIEHIEMVRT